MPVVCQLLSRVLIGWTGSRLFVTKSRKQLTCKCIKTSIRGLWTSNILQFGSPLSDPENKGRRQEGVNFDLLGSWSHRLELEVNIEQSVKHGRLIPEISVENIGAASLLGRRKENEDKWTADVVSSDILMFGVFDGHGGSGCVEYVCDHMLDHIRFWIQKEHKLEKVLENSFVDINNMFTRHLCRNNAGDEPDKSCGTTATVCLLRNGVELVIGHVGDSRALLCRDGQAVKLTRDHVPDDEAEANRIKECGGYVTWNSLGRPRVNGRLEMSRSIGDVELKSYGVTAQAETKSIQVKHSNDAFIVLFTDGIHFVLSNQEVVDIVGAAKDPFEAARMVTDQALMFGSEDNCSALVVPFGAWGKFSSKKMTFGFSRNMVGGRYS